MEKEFQIHTMVEYNEENNDTRISIRYTGPAFDPLAEGDDLSILLVKGLCEEISYGKAHTQPFTNELTMKLRLE